ncbi:hypothetical protein EW146_g10378, partial [Bondarzewia mesenterica]
ASYRAAARSPPSTSPAPSFRHDIGSRSSTPFSAPYFRQDGASRSPSTFPAPLFRDGEARAHAACPQLRHFDMTWVRAHPPHPQPCRVDTTGHSPLSPSRSIFPSSFIATRRPRRLGNEYVVKVLYSKMSGKNGKHTAVTQSSNISALSYIGVQLLEHMFDKHFRAVSEATEMFQTKWFHLLPPIAFISDSD